jgi:valyl-tRNA synthetase
VVPDGQDDPKTCDQCGSGKLTQDPDVLDTWFSSWLWPFSTLGWPDKTEDMDYFYPTDVLVTGVDILFFWVARMIMAGLEFVGPVPFRQVFFNGMVKDEIGRIMSKSIGNGIDPLEMIDKYGADALRFSLAALTTQGQDINLAENRLEMGRNFAQKVWSAARLLVMNMDGAAERDISLPAELDELSDRWIVSRYQAAVRNVGRALEKFHFSEAALAIYNFLWHEYCDWYLELAKPRLREQGVSRDTCLDVSRYVLDGSLGLLHPFMPFITEEIAALLPGGDGMLIGRRWPDYDDSRRDREAEESMTRLQEFVTSIRNLRHEFNVPPAKPVDLIFKLVDRRDIDLIRDCSGYLRLLAGAAEMETGPDMTRPDGSVARIGEGYEIYLILAGLIDLEAEKERLQRELAKAGTEQKNLGARLQNKEFLSKAPQNVIEKEKERLIKVRERIEKLSDTLTSLT